MQETQSMHVLQVTPSTFALATANGINVQVHATQILLQQFLSRSKSGMQCKAWPVHNSAGCCKTNARDIQTIPGKAYNGEPSCVFLQDEDFWAAFASLIRPVHDCFKGDVLHLARELHR
jgi:hypothetical protein